MLRQLSILIFISLCLAACNTRSVQKAGTLDFFQTPSPDMVFVPGNGSVPSFYMGVTEETNLNYNLYLKWLANSYSEYSEVYEWAIPGDTLLNDTIQTFNDPLYTQYRTHPAYANYPVVGLNWLQAMEYLQWKGDRLNEAILVNTGLNKLEMFRSVDDMFNTEAYFTMYWYGWMQGQLDKPLPEYQVHMQTLNSVLYGYNYRPEERVAINDGILFPAMRLPTEAEWEYLLALQQTTAPTPPGWKTPLPFGEKYYLRLWDDSIHCGLYDSVIANSNNTSQNNTGVFNDFKSISQAVPKVGGIANLQGNADEWLMDYYAPQATVSTVNFTQYLINNGFVLYKNLYATDGLFTGKVYNSNEMPFVYYSYYPTGEGGMFRSPGCFQMTQGMVTNNEYINFDSLHRAKLIIYDSVTKMDYYQKNPVLKNDTGHFITRWKYINSPDIYVVNHTVGQRVVRADNGEGKNRFPMHETHSSMRVGFRAVMSHGGFPLVNRKYKVKWE